MPWARVDDSFHDHPKICALLEEDDGAAAVGLWLLCLTWAHRHTRSKPEPERGRIPHHLPRRFVGKGWQRMTSLLEKAELWEVADGCWIIHDFADFLPAEQTVAARSAAGSQGAHARWHQGPFASCAECHGNLPSEHGSVPSGDSKSQWQNMRRMPGHGEGAKTMAQSHAGYSSVPSEDGEQDGYARVGSGSREPVGRTTVTDSQRELELRSSSFMSASKAEADSGLRDRPGDRDDVERVCQHLADRVEEQTGARPTVGVQWRRAARLMLDKDRRTEQQVHAAIDWCQDDEFWRSNILSMTKLRAQYIRLRAEAQRKARFNGRSSTTNERVSQGLELAARYAREEETQRKELRIETE